MLFSLAVILSYIKFNGGCRTVDCALFFNLVHQTNGFNVIRGHNPHAIYKFKFIKWTKDYRIVDHGLFFNLDKTINKRLQCYYMA